MYIGPVFGREAVTAPRRPRLYLYRSVYVTALLVLMATAWLVVAGTQIIRDVGDLARFGAILFQILAPLQLALIVFLAALMSASAVSQEKDRRTLILLLMTRMSNSELVLGKLFASLLNVGVMLAAALPVFMATTLFGGVSTTQVLRVFLVSLTTALVAGSLGSTIALWREKTFQTLSVTALAILMWLGVWQAVHAGLFFDELAGLTARQWGTLFSPINAIFVALEPTFEGGVAGGLAGVLGFVLVSLLGAALLNGIAIARVRVWNPSREVRPGQADQEGTSIWGAEHDVTRERPSASGRPEAMTAEAAEAARSGHVDARVRQAGTRSRRVWDNPILWREVCTWAYGRKVLIIRLAYLLLFAMAAAALYASISSGAAELTRNASQIIPTSVQPLAPFFLVSLVIINALAVTSITSERDGQALDLLLVTDLSPKEFVFGKLLGVLWITKEMVLLPLLLCIYLWWSGMFAADRLVFLSVGLVVMDIFVTMLGIHCGMTYANSRSAIGVSLGTVFFLFLGVVTCMVMMVSFSQSFQYQLAPFLAFILGGTVGLFVSLGIRNPSAAIGLSSLLLPFATFHAITSFLLGHWIQVFLVTVATYGFTTAAMMMPAIGEFDIAMGRTRAGGDD